MPLGRDDQLRRSPPSQRSLLGLPVLEQAGVALAQGQCRTAEAAARNVEEYGATRAPATVAAAAAHCSATAPPPDPPATATRPESTPGREPTARTAAAASSTRRPITGTPCNGY